MILDWTISEPVAVESPVWIWPYGVWEPSPWGPVRWVVLRGHLFVPFVLTHLFLQETTVLHEFVPAIVATGHAGSVPTAGNHALLAPSASGHTVSSPQATGHSFVPVE